MLDLVSIVGAGLILGAYVALQRRWLAPGDRLYNVMNLVGGVLLFVVAFVDRRPGFMILEGVWAAMTLPPLLHGDTDSGTT